METCRWPTAQQAAVTCPDIHHWPQKATPSCTACSPATPSSFLSGHLHVPSPARLLSISPPLQGAWLREHGEELGRHQVVFCTQEVWNPNPECFCDQMGSSTASSLGVYKQLDRHLLVSDAENGNICWNIFGEKLQLLVMNIN